MDETELESLVNARLRSIDSEEYKTCSFDGEGCIERDCSTCSVARDMIRIQIFEEEEDRIKKDEPAHLLEFRPNPLVKNGTSCNVNLDNTIAAATDTETILRVLGLPSTGWNVIDDGPELDKHYPLWTKLRDYVNKETPVQKLLLRDYELPLFIQCEGRALAIAPEIK